jgi:hypothetical protein
MTTLLVDHRVEDYETWRPQLDASWAQDFAKDIRSYQVWQDQDDPNHVFVANTLDSRAAAEALANDPMLRESMGAAGVIGPSVQITFLDEVAAGTR